MTDLKNNAFALAEAIGRESHCTPASVIVRDGHHRGVLFAWTGEVWIVVDLENRQWIGEYERLAVVTLHNEADPDNGLNQVCLACDLETPNGEWVLDAEALAEIRHNETYNDDDLESLWEQPGTPEDLLREINK